MSTIKGQLLPRFIRLRDAHSYLGMDRNRFNSEVRPYQVEIPIGKQGIAFDRLELDAYAEEYKQCNGRPGRKHGERLWDEENGQAFSSETVSGTSTRGSKGKEFAKALDQLALKRQSGS